jgi:hypothetical protein
MQPKRSLGNLSNVPHSTSLRPALTSQQSQQHQAYPFQYQAPLEIHTRKRSIALNLKNSVASQQHEAFLKQWEQRGKHKKLFSRSATLDYEADNDAEEEYWEEHYPEVSYFKVIKNF